MVENLYLKVFRIRGPRSILGITVNNQVFLYKAPSFLDFFLNSFSSFSLTRKFLERNIKRPMEVDFISEKCLSFPSFYNTNDENAF